MSGNRPTRTRGGDYATDWITVKTAWDLTSDETEVRGLEEMLNTCEENVTLNTVAGTTDDSGSGTSTTTTAALTSACPYTSQAGDPCAEIPALGNTINDVNCGDIPRKYKPLTVVGQDYDRLDGNNDGRSLQPLKQIAPPTSPRWAHPDNEVGDCLTIELAVRSRFMLLIPLVLRRNHAMWRLVRGH